MDKDIEKALIIELTKAKVAQWEEDQKGLSTQAIWWIQAYHDAKNEIKESEKNYAKNKRNDDY